MPPFRVRSFTVELSATAATRVFPRSALGQTLHGWRCLRRRKVEFDLGVGFQTEEFKDCFDVQEVFRAAVLDEVALTDCRLEKEKQRNSIRKRCLNIRPAQHDHTVSAWGIHTRSIGSSLQATTKSRTSTDTSF